MNKSLNFLKNPLVVISSIVIGVLIGLNFKNISLIIAPFGEMYLYLLQMCVIPILITSIISSMGYLVKKSETKIIKKIIVYFFIFLFSASSIGILTGLILQPGSNFSKENKEKVGKFIEKSSNNEILEVELFSPDEIFIEEGFALINFITSIVPKNIFSSLTSGRAIEVVFFTMILGISIGMLKGKSSVAIISLSSALFIAFQKIMNTTIYFLPFALVCLIADQVRTVGLGVIFPMINLIVAFYSICILFIVANTVVLKFRSKESILTVIKALNEPITIAFFTRSSLAAIPSAVKSLEYYLSFERSICNLMIPLGVTLGRYGNILYFSLSSIFIIQLYEVNFGITELSLVLIGSIFAGTATAGATGFATLPLIAIALAPLKIPVEVVLVLLYAVDTMIDPMRTMINVHTNIVITSLVSGKYKDIGKRKEDVYEETII